LESNRLLHGDRMNEYNFLCFFVVEFRKNTGETTLEEWEFETTAKKVITLQRVMTKKTKKVVSFLRKK